MTLNGALVAAGAVVALSGGIVSGYSAGIVVGIACVALLVAGLPVSPLPGRRLHVGMAADPAVTERGSVIEVVITSTGPAVARLRVGAEPVDLVVGGRPLRWTSPPLPRGRLTVVVDELVAVGSLGLWRRRLRFTGGQAEVLVRPRHVDLAEPPARIDLDRDDHPARIGAGTGSSFAGLRLYAAGDDLRHIDWAASARSGTGDLYVRHFAPALAEDLIVVLDPRLAAVTMPDRAEAFEVAVDLAWSFVLAGADLTIDGEPEPVRGREAAREVLIALTPRAVLSAAPAASPPGGVVAVITACPADSDRLNRSYGHDVPVLDVTGNDLAAAAAGWARWARR